MTHAHPPTHYVQRIDSLDDPRVRVYRNLKDRDVANEERGLVGRFIAEGEQVVRRLIQSGFPIESVLLAERRCVEISPLVPPDVPVYVVPDAMVQQVIGFKFHSGVIACGRRLPAPSLAAVMEQLPERATLVACPEIANTENLGALIRLTAGFGADAMILGPQCCDPFYRQSIRVSMGAVFSLKLVRSLDLIDDLRLLRDRYDFERIATVLDSAAQPVYLAKRPARVALLFGNEAQGLRPDVLAECDMRLTIPMQLGTDSLNVAIAAAVFLYHFSMVQR